MNSCRMCWGREARDEFTSDGWLAGLTLCGRCAIACRQACNFLVAQGYEVIHPMSRQHEHTSGGDGTGSPPDVPAEAPKIHGEPRSKGKTT